MNALARFVARYSRSILVFFTVVTVFFAFQATKIEMTTDIEEFFPEDDPRVEAYETVETEFGSADYVMVALDVGDVFSVDALAGIESLTTDLGEIKGISDVQSLTEASEIRGTDWGIEVAPLLEELPQTDAQMSQFRSKVMSDPMYRGTLVSEDERSALIVLELDPAADSDKTVDEVNEIVAAYDGPGELYVTGTPVLNHELVSSMKSDLRQLIPIVLVIIAVVLFLYFRTLWGTVLPFVTALIAIAWTLGLMAMLEKPLSPLSSVLPVILLSLGNAYAIYIITRWNDYRSAHAVDDTLRKTLISIGVAVMMAGTTTLAGFSSNGASQISLMRDFGIFTSFGILVALSTALLFVPAALKHLPHVSRVRQTDKPGVLDRFLHALQHVATERPRTVLVTGLIVVLVAGAGVNRLSTDSNFFNFFDPESGPRIAYELVKERFGGSETVEIVVTGDLRDPELLGSMEALQNDMLENEKLSSPSSAIDILQRVDLAMNPAQTEGRTPESEDLAAQYYLLMEMDEENMLERFVNLDYSTGRIQARASDTSAAGTETLVRELDESVRRSFSDPDNVTITGIVFLMDALADLLVQGQVASLLLSIVLVFLIVRVILRSWEGSLLSVALIATVTLVNFGVMGWVGIPLDIVTVLISSIGIGVGIDYAIHMYSAFMEEVDGGLQPRDALPAAIRTRGRSIMTNAGAVAAGFVVLAGSSFPPLRYFGILVTGSMLMASLGALTLLPAAIAWRMRRRLGGGDVGVDRGLGLAEDRPISR